MSRNQRVRLFAGAAFVAVAAFAAGSDAAWAAASADATSVEEVVVTGTNIKRPNLVAASPLTVVDDKEIKLQGATTVESVINRLPQFTADANENVSNGSDGTARVNLRNLGSNRVLVLVDGRRMLPPETADVNFIPAALVDRIDVVTGGASAVYGSDAVAGVVNFIMKKDLNGLRIDANYGIAEHENDAKYVRSVIQAANYDLPKSTVWDGDRWDITAALGLNSPDGKGNITLYGGYREVKPVTQDTRDYSACALNLAGANNDEFSCGGSSNNQWGKFVLLSGPNAGANLNNAKDGSHTWVPYDSSFLYNYAPTNYIQRSDQRYTAGAFGHYQVASWAEAYANFMFMDDHTFSQAAPSALFQGTVFNINCDNPLMSGQQAGLLCGGAAGTAVDQQTFIGYRLTGPGSQPRRDDLRHTDYRADFGFRGDINDAWSYDANFLYSKVVFDESYKNDVDNAKAQRGLEVVDVNGTPTCKSVLDGSDLSCVPLDVFAYNGISKEGYQYIYAPTYTHGVQTEKVLSLKLNGDLDKYGIRSPWANDGAAIALGAEHRKETLDFQADALAQSKGTKNSNGQYSVNELYAELDLPLVQDAPMAKLLSVNAGYRYSNYKVPETTAAPAHDTGVSTYKVELQWAPTSDVRFRAGYNRAVRGPSISELFAPQSVGNVSGQDPCSGPSPQATLAQCEATGVTAAQYGHIPECPADVCDALGGGNPNLDPEVANTYTAGLVLTPQMIPGFSASVDYFNIKVDGYIGGIDPQTIIAQCIQTGNPFFCSLFHRDPQIGVLFGTNGYVVSTNQNTGFLKTSGVDFTANYRWDIGSWGRLDFDMVGTYLIEREISQLPGLGSYDCAGLFGPTCGEPNPTWRHQARMTWSMPFAPASLSLNWRYFGAVDLSSNTNDPFLHGDYVEINKRIAAYNYFDLAATWSPRPDVTLRVGVNNMFDKDAPAIAAGLLSAFGNGNTYPGVYDPMGRTMFVGITANF